MESNPYSTPKGTADERFAGATVQYRVFRAQSVSFKLSSGMHHEQVRRGAQHTIDEEIGAENVISIIEHAGAFDGFSVVPTVTSTS